MRKLEIKSIEAISAFKSTIYVSIIPLALISILGVLLTVIGMSTGETTLTIIGVTYIFLPLVMIVIYGLFSMLGAFIYSKLAAKFGGLEVTVVDKEQTDTVPSPSPSQHIE
jgi:hypothetical protein